MSISARNIMRLLILFTVTLSVAGSNAYAAADRNEQWRRVETEAGQ